MSAAIGQALGAAQAEPTADGGSIVVLVLNSGSSSLKHGLYRVSRWRIDCLNDGIIEDADADPLAAIVAIVRQLAEAALPPPQRIGHRIVHGGPHRHRHGRIDAQVLQQLEAAAPFAPLHAAKALALIRHCGSLFPGHPQVACYDTAFHAAMPALGATLPLPKALRDSGLRRYGFHGLSCESVLDTLGADCPPRVVIAHLGNGVSISAVRDGRSIDTSMGLTPNGGAIMGTRCGDLDPGVLLHLLQQRQFDGAALSRLLEHESGLLGLSGVSSDLRAIRAAADRGNRDAAFAIEAFCLSVARQIAAMIAVLDGLDLLVFTAGIGEHDAAAREGICAHLGWIGVSLDGGRNAAGNAVIHGPASRCAIRVVPCREDEQIARHAADAA